MKQTPIPEKIYCKSNVMDLLLKETVNVIIDVLTEQQDRLDRHNDRIAETNEHFSNRFKELYKEIDKLKNNFYSFCTFMGKKESQPYTAMRSTGEKIADEQENREKQMKEDMRVVLDEFWMNGKEAGYLMKYDNVITTDKIIERILAIVKGE